MPLSNGPIGTGIAFILVSLLCKYGAEKDTGSLASGHVNGETVEEKTVPDAEKVEEIIP